jgi:phosphoribosyl-AMP cyclohydrolase
MYVDMSKLFEKSELIPCIAQDIRTMEVLMLGYVNQEAAELTIKTKTAWFWSRSRGKLWNKGETSGNYLHVEKVLADCDWDTLLLLCRPDGPACHTGKSSCFFNRLPLGEDSGT